LHPLALISNLVLKLAIHNPVSALPSPPQDFQLFSQRWSTDCSSGFGCFLGLTRNGISFFPLKSWPEDKTGPEFESHRLQDFFCSETRVNKSGTSLSENPARNAQMIRSAMSFPAPNHISKPKKSFRIWPAFADGASFSFPAVFGMVVVGVFVPGAASGLLRGEFTTLGLVASVASLLVFVFVVTY
jgi:hypothetical protein